MSVLPAILGKVVFLQLVIEISLEPFFLLRLSFAAVFLMDVADEDFHVPGYLDLDSNSRLVYFVLVLVPFM